MYNMNLQVNQLNETYHHTQSYIHESSEKPTSPFHMNLPSSITLMKSTSNEQVILCHLHDQFKGESKNQLLTCGPAHHVKNKLYLERERERTIRSPFLFGN